MSNKVVYIGRDLESMSFALSYHRWIFDEFKPFLGKHIVEVGAGTGAFSELLLEKAPESLLLVEPSEMFEFLKQNISQLNPNTSVHFYQNIFTEIANQIKQPVDSVVYVNVLEHVEDDKLELKTVSETLAKGGKCFVFVPALMSLYGEFDRKIGHFRRYTKEELEDKCEAAGLKVIKSKYVDLAGIIPWYIKYKILKSDSLESSAVTLYDKIAVPIIRKFEEIVRVPIGKNILLVAEKK